LSILVLIVLINESHNNWLLAEAATTVLFHFHIRLWTASAVHENENSADMNARSFKDLTGLRAGIGRPPRRAKALCVKIFGVKR